MNKTHYISKLLGAHWGLDKMRGRTVLCSIIHPLLPHPTSDRPEQDIFGEPLPCMQKLGDIARIPIEGVMSIEVPDWLKEYGVWLTDVLDIEKEINDALQDANISMLVFDTNSPGGMSIAGNYLFEIIEAANKKKPCFYYTGPGRDNASACFDSIAGCTAGACSPHSEGVGCVGSYLAYLDDTEFWAKMGITWRIFKSGEYKGIGGSVPLTKNQEDFLQSQADYYGTIIRKNVKKYRTGIADEDLQGQWYPGRLAAQKGFVYTLADDLQSALAKFRRLTKAAA